ncbi:MAG: SLC13 family permease [Desulfurococcaceae archaeon]
MHSLLTVCLLIALVALLIWNKIERHWVSLVILLILVLTNSLSLNEIIKYVDWDVLGLIIGVSILSVYLERSGFTGLIASYIVNISRGSRLLFLLLVSFIAGLISIFMENVSVVILMFPIVISASRIIGLNPVIPSILMALSANISGSATMIGDPPAIITAGAFNLSFIDFIVYEGKPSMFFFTIVSMITAIIVSCYIGQRRLESIRVDNAGGESNRLFVYTIFTLEAILSLAVKIFLLSLRHSIGVSLTLTALISIGLLTLLRIVHRDLVSVRVALKRGFEWKLILFLVGVFALSGSFEKHGLAALFAEYLLRLSSRNSVLITSSLLFLSVVLSAVIDNVPITVTMIPVVVKIGELVKIDPVVIMWSVLIGLTLGGNLTYIGASANLTIVRLLEKNGYRVSFIDFIKISIIYNTVSVFIAWILYLITYFM